MSDSHEPQITFIAPDIAELAPHFPGYEFQGLIATGGMGAVYWAVQKSLDRTVAIKILPKECGQDAAFAASFEAEAKAMARLNHPNLIGVYDFGEVNGMLYIIMEFVPGKSLYHSAHGLAIEPKEVIRLVTGICSGLAHAHKNGILHRDIKPSNILLDQNAHPKIGDFGLARPIGTKVQDGEDIFGTPQYTAPEVCNAPHSVGQRADIFSVGVLLHELLTGRLPVEDPRPASSICQCDHRFDAIIRRATDPVPERRYASAEEIARDLRAITQQPGQPAHFKIPKASPQRARAARVNKPLVYEQQSSSMPGIIMLLVAVVIGVLAFKHFANVQQARKLAAQQAAAENQTPTAPEPEPAPVEPPTKDPSVPPTTPEPPVIPTPTDPGDKPPEPETVVEPKFDVPAFFTFARKKMQERAAPIAAKHKTNLKNNFWSFEKGVLQAAGRLTVDRIQTVAQVTKTIARIKDEDGRVPVKLESSLAEIPGVPAIYDEMFEKQKNFDFELRRDVNELAPTYILGLRKQIERLKTENDPAAITLIEAEIEKTRSDPDYFSSLMLGDSLPREKPPEAPDEYVVPEDE